MDDFRNLPFVRAVIGIQSYNIGCDAIAQFIFCIYSFVRYHCNKYFIRYDWYGCSVCGRKAFSFPCGTQSQRCKRKYFRNTSRTSACKLMLWRNRRLFPVQRQLLLFRNLSQNLTWAVYCRALYLQVLSVLLLSAVKLCLRESLWITVIQSFLRLEK